MNRRQFLSTAAIGAGAVATGCAAAPATNASTTPASDVPDVIRALKPMTAGIVPIPDDERRARIAKAQKLMAEQKIDLVDIVTRMEKLMREQHTPSEVFPFPELDRSP